MITAEIAQASIAIAEEFDRRKLRIVTTTNGSLACLTACTGVNFTAPTSVIVTADEANAPYEPNAEILATESSYPSAENSSESMHDRELDAMVTEISDAVSCHLSFAKNTVAPLVRELAGRVSAALSAYPTEATFNPSIVRVDLPEPMLNPAVEEAVMVYKDTPYITINHHMSLPSLTTQEVIAAMKTGSGTADAAIDVWAAKCGDEFFRHLWSAIFTDELQSSSITSSFEQLAVDKLLGADYMFGVFLLSKRLLDTPPEGAEQPLAEYRKTMGALLEQSAIRLVKAYDKRALDEKTQLLHVGSVGDLLYVFKPVYEAWLADGGNNAVLFGNVLADRPSLFAPAIDAAAPELLQLWERRNRFMTVTLVNRRMVEARKTIAFKVEELVAENLVECFGGYAAHQSITFHTPEVMLAMQKVTEYLDEVTDGELGDLWTVCTRLISQCVFYYTDAYTILVGIDAAKRLNPEIEVSEAALLSLIEYVTDYVCDQLTVVDL